MARKQKNKYVTLESGTDFRKIAEIMSAAGFPMNHATARNVLLVSLKSLFKNVSEELGVPISKPEITKMLRNQQVHEALADILSMVWEDLQTQKEKEEGKTNA